jgi:hypothetical protein
MNQQDGTNPEPDPIDILEANFKSVVEELTSQASPGVPDAKPSTSFRSKSAEMIKTYPIAAIGIAFGAGFFFMRLLRRSNH